jgi:hypothetical protein
MTQMTQTEQLADQRLERAIEDVHLDELRHPDPSGQCLLRLLGAVEAHVRDESVSVETYARIGRETSDPVVAVVMERRTITHCSNGSRQASRHA